MQRDYEYDDRRRRQRPDNDPRERYGNEEDQYSREYRRAYSEQNLPRRLHDDRPYDRPGYEPEAGRPGGRENVNLDQNQGRRQAPGGNPGRYEDRWQGAPSGEPYGYDWEQPAGRAGSARRRQGTESGDQDWQGGYYGQGQRFQGNPFDVDRQLRESDRRQRGNQPYSQRGQRGAGQSGGSSGSGYGSSPYTEGDMGPWYGGDTGMGDYGASEPGVQSGGPYRSMHNDRPMRSGGRSESFAQQTSGPFSGRGPRGYRRSDARIQEDVCEMLTRHGEIDASAMEVEVQHGTVILRGMADSGHIRRLTEELVEGVHGVHDVQNELRVNQRTGYSNTSYTQTGSTTQGDNVPAYGVGVAETSGVSTRTGPGEPGASAGAGRSQHGNPWQVRETMDVIGADGKTIGAVKTVRGTDFLVDRPMERDLYVPFSAVRTVDGERIMLTCSSAEVDHQNWPSPSLTGTSEAPKAR